MSKVSGSQAILRSTGCKQHEIEPGRSVINNWDRWLFEPWAARKARLARERQRQEPSHG